MTAQDHLPSSRHGAKELTEERKKKREKEEKKKKNQISHRRLRKCAFISEPRDTQLPLSRDTQKDSKLFSGSREKPAGSCGSPSESSNYPHQESNRQPDLNPEAKKGRNKTQALQ